MAASNCVILENVKLKRLKDEVFAKPSSNSNLNRLPTDVPWTQSNKVATISHTYSKGRELRLVVDPILDNSLSEDQNPVTNTSSCEVTETDNSPTNDKESADHATSELKRNTDEPIKTSGSSQPKKRKKSKKLKVFTEHTGPEWHKVSNSIVTKPIISSNLPEVFKDFPIFGRPRNDADLKSFQDRACREFVGLPDDEYDKLQEFCR